MTQSTSRLTPTTKSIDDLYQLYLDGRLDLKPDYQRNSVWPPKARAYLIDSILMDKPIPMLFLYKYRDSNSNRMHYRVIDGQQRLRAAFAFLENRFSTTESTLERITRKRFKKLEQADKDQFMSYSFVVMELLGFSEIELRDIFTRINRYVVRLNPQELRDAEHPGPFKTYVDAVSSDPVWNQLGVFTAAQIKRKRDKEFIAELTILMLEGPQDKKGSVDLYFQADEQQFEESAAIHERLVTTTRCAKSIINRKASIYLKHPCFYALMGALYNLSEDAQSMLAQLENSEAVRQALAEFETTVTSLPTDLQEASELAKTNQGVGSAFQFLSAIRSQTDNIRPRIQAIKVLQLVIERSLDIDRQYA
jgi:hypothetical protein